MILTAVASFREAHTKFKDKGVYVCAPIIDSTKRIMERELRTDSMDFGDIRRARARKE